MQKLRWCQISGVNTKSRSRCCNFITTGYANHQRRRCQICFSF